PRRGAAPERSTPEAPRRRRRGRYRPRRCTRPSPELGRSAYHPCAVGILMAGSERRGRSASRAVDGRRGARGRAWLALALALGLAAGCGPPARDGAAGARAAGTGAEAGPGGGPAAAPREPAASNRPPDAPPDAIKVGYLGLILSNAGIFL